MTKLLRLPTILTLTLFCLNSFAATVVLTKATSDEDNETIVVSLIVDSNYDITGLNQKSVLPNGKVVKNANFKVSQAYDGFTLMKKDGRKIVTLFSKNLAAHQGGRATMDYLYSGVTGKRGAMHFDLSRDGDSWSLRYNGKKARKLHFVSNKNFIIGTIGIKKIIVK